MWMDVLLFTGILSDAQEVYAYSLFTQIWGLSVCDRVTNRLSRGGVSPRKRARGGASTRAARCRVALCTGLVPVTLTNRHATQHHTN